ncbi:hypothetical protein [Pseudomonas sp. 008]|uniref:hypothetical protein n=1 Tax=Pseudomonas sp. 008 TaxID=2803906 RepID=UPI00194DCA8C|nr:hypothetical protein [Pseudomonas sp. 008]GID08351.1 hypothetical protein TMM008_55530 [Pseudomonas sp. 008]
MSAGMLIELNSKILKKGPFASGTVKSTIESRPDFESTQVIFRRISDSAIQIIGIMNGRHWEFIFKDNLTLGKYNIGAPEINNFIYVQTVPHDPDYDHVFIADPGSGGITVIKVDFVKGELEFDFKCTVTREGFPGTTTKTEGKVAVSGMQQTRQHPVHK